MLHSSYVHKDSICFPAKEFWTGRYDAIYTCQVLAHLVIAVLLRYNSVISYMFVSMVSVCNNLNSNSSEPFIVIPTLVFIFIICSHLKLRIQVFVQSKRSSKSISTTSTSAFLSCCSVCSGVIIQLPISALRAYYVIKWFFATVIIIHVLVISGILFSFSNFQFVNCFFVLLSSFGK